MRRRIACACGERTTTANVCPGSVKSSPKLPAPVTSRWSSRRRGELPMPGCFMVTSVMICPRRGFLPKMRVPARRRAAKPSSGRRNPLARQEFGKCVLGPGIAHHLCGVTMLCRPTRVEALCLLLEQQRLDPPDGTAMVIRYHFRDLHRLGAQLAFGDQVIEKTNAIGLLGLYDARSEQQLLGLRPADLAAK